MNVLVTGGAGFIGRHLVKRLYELGGYNVFCLARNPNKVKLYAHAWGGTLNRSAAGGSGSRAKALKPYGVKLIYADITDKSSLDKVLNYKIDVVFHCAAYVDNKPLDLLQKVNVEGTKNICELSLKLRAERLVYLSSVAVIYGNSQVPLTEDLPYKATNNYGESKIEAEKKALEYRQKGLRLVIIRPPMVYGEDEPHALRSLLGLLRLRLFPLVGRAQNKLHLVYVENVVEAMIYSLGREEFLEGSFFVADNEVLRLRQVFTVLGEAIGAKPAFTIPDFFKPLILSMPYIGKKINSLLEDRVFSIERIRSLGFSPPYPAVESLKRSAQALHKN